MGRHIDIEAQSNGGGGIGEEERKSLVNVGRRRTHSNLGTKHRPIPLSFTPSLAYGLCFVESEREREERGEQKGIYISVYIF